MEPVYEQIEFLKSIATRLTSAGIPYMVTGSMAMAFHAVPRMTRGLDFVIECRPADVERIASLFDSDCYADRSAIRSALEERSSFNVIHTQWMIKADFFVGKDDPYRAAEIERKQVVDVDGVPVSIVSVEDLVLSKLVWSREGESDLQLRDARAVAEAAEGIDWSYIRSWADRLGVADLLRRIRSA